jgi:hypothetical protein
MDCDDEIGAAEIFGLTLRQLRGDAGLSLRALGRLALYDYTRLSRAERRRELLDRTLIWNQAHLLHALREFEQFYNAHRPHHGIANARPLCALPPPIPEPDGATRLHVRRRDRLGGILHEYRHAALPARMKLSASTPSRPSARDSQGTGGHTSNGWPHQRGAWHHSGVASGLRSDRCSRCRA